MNRQPKPNQSSLPSNWPEGDASTFDVTKLLDKCGVILEREIGNLMRASATDKLKHSDAKDLVQYIKLLTDVKATQEAELSKLTKEQLEAISNAVPK